MVHPDVHCTYIPKQSILCSSSYKTWILHVKLIAGSYLPILWPLKLVEQLSSQHYIEVLLNAFCYLQYGVSVTYKYVLMVHMAVSGVENSSMHPTCH